MLWRVRKWEQNAAVPKINTFSSNVVSWLWIYAPLIQCITHYNRGRKGHVSLPPMFIVLVPGMRGTGLEINKAQVVWHGFTSFRVHLHGINCVSWSCSPNSCFHWNMASMFLLSRSVSSESLCNISWFDTCKPDTQGRLSCNSSACVPGTSAYKQQPVPNGSLKIILKGTDPHHYERIKK